MEIKYCGNCKVLLNEENISPLDETYCSDCLYICGWCGEGWILNSEYADDDCGCGGS